MTPTLDGLLSRYMRNRPSGQALIVGLLGPNGSGKSLALSDLMTTLGQQRTCATVDFRLINDEQMETTYEFILTSIDRDMGRGPTRRARPRLGFVQYLRDLVVEKPQLVVIGFDHLEHLSEETARQFVSDLREVQNHSDERLGRLTCLLAGCLSLDDLKRRFNSPNLQFVSETFPLSRKGDRVMRVQAWLSEQGWQAEAAAVEQLAEETGGEPHFLELVATFLSGPMLTSQNIEEATRRAVEGGGGSDYLSGIARIYWLDRQLRKQVARLLDGQPAFQGDRAARPTDIDPLQLAGALLVDREARHRDHFRNGMIRRLFRRLQDYRLNPNHSGLPDSLVRFQAIRIASEGARDLGEALSAFADAIEDLTGERHSLRLTIHYQNSLRHCFPPGPAARPELDRAMPVGLSIAADGSLLQYGHDYRGARATFHFSRRSAFMGPLGVATRERLRQTEKFLDQYAGSFLNLAMAEIATSNLVQTPEDPRRVFVIHGRDLVSRDSFFAFLSSLGLRPLSWDDARALTGQAAPFVFDVIDRGMKASQACVALLTGDDEARLHQKFLRPEDQAHERQLTPQARPNVLIEAGMALARYRDRTLLVEFGDNLRPASDLGGFNLLRFKDSQSSRESIAKALATAGCPVVLPIRSSESPGSLPQSKRKAASR